MDEISASVSEVAKSSGEIASSVMELSHKNHFIITESNSSEESALKLEVLIQEFNLFE